MRRANGWRAWEAASLAVLMLLQIAGCHSDGQSCQRNADCAMSGGRSCVPSETWCDNGTCKAACRSPCKTIEPDVNTCLAPLICNDTGKMMAYPPYCTGSPITCATAEDCPLYRPLDSGGAASTWQCEAGRCVYPGLDYIIGRP